MRPDARRYAAVNNFFSDIFELSLNGWGDAQHLDRRLLRGTPNVNAPDFVEIGVGTDGRVSRSSRWATRVRTRRCTIWSAGESSSTATKKRSKTLIPI